MSPGLWEDYEPAPGDRRYEIGILIGPCSEDEAEAMMELVAEFVLDSCRGAHGACVSMGRWKEDAPTCEALAALEDK